MSWEIVLSKYCFKKSCLWRWPVLQHVFYGHWMLCCLVGYVEQRGTLPLVSSLTDKRIYTTRLPIGFAFTNCPSIGQADSHSRHFFYISFLQQFQQSHNMEKFCDHRNPYNTFQKGGTMSGNYTKWDLGFANYKTPRKQKM